MKYAIISIIFFIPFIFANAQVIINEIAWMGSDNGGTSVQNANDEWIELYNNSNEAVDLSGWSLNADDGSPSITLEGVINAGEFFLLERSDDNSVPFVMADLIYVGALSNSGEILRIKDTEGVVIDTADGTDEWQNIGGDNETKETAQRVSSIWVTAYPTPKSENTNSTSNESDNSSLDTNEDENQTQTSSNNENNKNQKSSFLIEPQIFAYAGEDREVIVGADTIFEGKSFGLKKEPLTNARYLWNFGDGKTKEGKNVLYYYKYPGEYIVILNVSSGEFSVSDRIIVKAFEADISISSVEDDFIEIFNKTNQELNFSLWQLRSGNDYFTIPKDTIILPNKKLIFSSDITKLNTKNKKDVFLLYPNGTEAIKFEEIKVLQKNLPTGGEVEKVNIQKQIPQKTESSIKTNQTKEIPDTNSVNLEKKTTDKNNQKDTVQTASAVSSISADKKDSQIYKWLFILFGIIVASVGILIHTSSKKEPGDDIEIIE